MSILNLATYSFLAFSTPLISNTVHNNSNVNQAYDKSTVDVVSIAAFSNESNLDIFTDYIENIQNNLPFGLKMRLPSVAFFSENKKRYQIDVSNDSRDSLIINVFNCGEKQSYCLVGSFSVARQTSIEAQQEFIKYKKEATPITLKNNIKGYLYQKNPQINTEFSSVMWEQDGNFYTAKIRDSVAQITKIASSMAVAEPILDRNSEYQKAQLPLTQPSQSQASQIAIPELNTKSSVELSTPTQLKKVETPTINEASPTITDSVDKKASLLQKRSTILTTAEHLRQGEIVTNLRLRQTFPPDTIDQVGLTGQPTFGFSWGVTDSLEFTIDAQTVDNSGPVRQGEFAAQRINANPGIRSTGTNFFQEFAFQVKQRLWQNSESSQALSGVITASIGNGKRPFTFKSNGDVFTGQRPGLVYSLELPFTVTTNNRWQFTLSPKVAFLPEDNALYFNRLPTDKKSSFGTNFGLATGVSYQLNPRLILWGDAFIPFTGNNTINRDTGLPTRSIAYNAGLRYLVNPRLSTDLFVSNTLGNTGALSVITDKDYPALGLGITYLPGFTGANRRYSQHFSSSVQPPPSTTAGFGWLDGGTIPNQQLLFSLQGGQQGLLTGIRYGLLDDFEIGAYLSSIPGTVDESQLGFSGKIRFLNQADGAPVTLSAAATIARSNNVLINFVNNNRNEFRQRGLTKGGFAFSNERDGELFIITLSTPMHYQFKGGSAVWLTPTLGFVQRSGLDIGGFNFGASVPVFKNIDVIAEAGVDILGNGNAFIGNSLQKIIPWTVGLRWYPGAVTGMQLETYLTNRLGTSPYDSLRVRADNDTAVGFGLILPIQF